MEGVGGGIFNVFLSSLFFSKIHYTKKRNRDFFVGKFIFNSNQVRKYFYKNAQVFQKMNVLKIVFDSTNMSIVSVTKVLT